MKKLLMLIISLSLFGFNSYGKIEPSSELKIKNISTNLWATYFLDENGTVWGIGDNIWMIFGETENSFISEPLKIMDEVKEVYPRGFSTVMLKKDDTLWVVGGNNYNDLGVGDIDSVKTPVQIMKNVEKIFWKECTLMILKKDKTLWVVGDNHDYKLGIGSEEKASIPMKISKNVKSVIFGDYCNMIIQEDGTLLGMGSNIHGQLGTGDNNPRTFPTFITSNVENVYCDYSYSLILKKDGSLWQTPYFDSKSHDNPVKSLTKVAENILDVNSSYGPLLLLKTDKSLWKEKGEYDGTGGTSKNFIKVLDNVDRINPYIFKNNKDLDFYYCEKNNYKISFEEYLYKYSIGDYILKKNGDLVFGDNHKFITGNVKDISYSNNYIFILKFDGTIWKIDYNDTSFNLEKITF